MPIAAVIPYDLMTCVPTDYTFTVPEGVRGYRTDLVEPYRPAADLLVVVPVDDLGAIVRGEVLPQDAPIRVAKITLRQGPFWCDLCREMHDSHCEWELLEKTVAARKRAEHGQESAG